MSTAVCLLVQIHRMMSRANAIKEYRMQKGKKNDIHRRILQNLNSDDESWIDYRRYSAHTYCVASLCKDRTCSASVVER